MKKQTCKYNIEVIYDRDTVKSVMGVFPCTKEGKVNANAKANEVNDNIAYGTVYTKRIKNPEYWRESVRV